jgi:hypothetical protein
LPALATGERTFRIGSFVPTTTSGCADISRGVQHSAATAIALDVAR